MGTPAPQVLRIGTRQTLDTANPESDRPPGTLVTARDLHHKWIGPRKGRRRIASAWDYVSGANPTAMLANQCVFDGAAESLTASLYNDQFRDLGTTWTVDLYFTLTNVSYTADTIHLFSWFTGAVEAIRITISPATSKATATVKLTSSRGVVGETDTLTAASGYEVVTGASSLQSQKMHLRLVRNGSALTMFVNGYSAATASCSALYASEGALGSIGTVQLSNGAIAASHAYFLGRIWFCVVRDTAHTTLPIEAVPTCNPQAANVRVFLTAESKTRHARSSDTGGMYDMGPYHVQSIGPSTTDSTAIYPPPAMAAIQGMGTVATRDGTTLSAVMCGGVLNLRYST